MQTPTHLQHTFPRPLGFVRFPQVWIQGFRGFLQHHEHRLHPIDVLQSSERRRLVLDAVVDVGEPSHAIHPSDVS